LVFIRQHIPAVRSNLFLLTHFDKLSMTIKKGFPLPSGLFDKLFLHL
jgi:hypothetical protein